MSSLPSERKIIFKTTTRLGSSFGAIVKKANNVTTYQFRTNIIIFIDIQITKIERIHKQNKIQGKTFLLLK